MKSALPESAAPQLLGDIRQLIEASRAELAVAVNSALTQLYWSIGQRIRTEVLQGERAAYGEQIVSALARQLEADYGRGFSGKNLRHMLRFAEAIPSEEIVSAVRRQLSWTHIKTLIYIDDPLKRDFYLQMCQQERWSTRTLQQRLDSMLFERTALSRQPDELLAQELAILRELEDFLLELGAGFTFVARQKRLQIDNDDFYIDLLLYNRRLKRLVAIDLKLGDFKAADKGQMELYLRWLAKHEQEAGEAAPLGIILCSGKKQEQIELLELDASGIHVAEYLTSLPPKEVLQQKLHEAIARSRARLDNRNEEQA